MDYSLDLAAMSTGIIALGLSFYSLRVNKKITSSDHVIAESVKEDLLHLIATLNSILTKSMWNALYHNYDHQIDNEIKELDNFLHSPSGVIFNLLITKKENDSTLSDAERKSWRLFTSNSMTLLRLEDDDFIETALTAKNLLELLETITENEVNYLVHQSNNLPAAITNIKNMRDNDAIEVFDRVLKVKEDQNSEFLKFLMYLRDTANVVDPDVDLIVGTLTENVSILTDALDRGGDLDISDIVILERYSSFLKDYIKVNPCAIYSLSEDVSSIDT